MEKYTLEQIRKAVAVSHSWRQVAKNLGSSLDTGGQTYISKRAKRAGIDCSHFTGQGWAKGKKLTYARKGTQDFLRKGIVVSSHKLRRRLIEDGIKKAECEHCGLRKWRGFDIPLELDHINSDREDNRLSNLQILCPNCHALKTSNKLREPNV